MSDENSRVTVFFDVESDPPAESAIRAEAAGLKARALVAI